jgi:predicted RNA methylase
VKVTTEVLNVLTARVEADGNNLVLTGPRMDARLYQQVNEVLEAVGGRWAKNVQAHVFPLDAAAALAPVLATGHVVTLREKRQQAQYFPTPTAVVERLVELAQLQPGMEVLEPSAGSGAIATALAAQGAIVDCVERDPSYAAALADTGTARALRAADFLHVPPQPQYDRVVMNPPFTKGADMAHVEHALRFLKPDGLLVSVMSWTVTEHGRATAKFRGLVEQRGGTVEAVPEGAFRGSGTDVGTVIVAIPAARPQDARPVVWPALAVPEAPEEDFRSPAEILDDIRANLRDAMAEFDALADLLAQPTRPTAESPTADVVELPEQRLEQLSFDALGEAS